MKFTSLKNLPLGLKISLLALIAILGLSAIANIFVEGKSLKENLGFFKASSEQCLDSIRDDLEAGNLAGACEIMKKAGERKLTGFFIIQMGGAPVCYAPADQLDAFNIDYKQFDKVINSSKGNFDFKSIKVAQYVATAGWLNNSKANYLKFVSATLPTILLGILIFILPLCYIVFRETKPIKKLLAVFKKSARVSDHLEPSKKSMLGPASEIQQLWRSAYAFEKTTERLKDEVQFVSQDAQNFLRREIAQKNEKIPYRFFSSMLRFDMNNYTKTFVEDPEATQALILRLSIEADELVHRYGGLHYGFGGDEFIVLFRDTDVADSRALSFACMRDIFLKVEEVFSEAKGSRKVTIKASICHSENVLFKLPNGLFLRGLNLILSQRYLTTVAVKDVNKLVVNKEDLKVLMPLGEFSQAQAVSLKGLQGDFELCEQTRFTDIKEILEVREAPHLTYFRSDSDISHLLSCLASEGMKLLAKMDILTHLKSFEVCRAEEQLANDFVKCFQSLDKNPIENKVLLSSLLIVGEKIIPKQIWSSEMSQVILNANCKTESRCNSSILRLLAVKAPLNEFDFYTERVLAEAPGPDFRSIGNFLIAKAKIALTDELLQECVRMLKSKNDLEIATGIYSASRIIQAQKQVDPVALSQFNLVPDLILQIQNLQSHRDSMVSSRALIEYRELTHLEKI